MDQNRIADIVNMLVDMLMDEGVDAYDIADRLDMSDYEKAFLKLGWLD